MITVSVGPCTSYTRTSRVPPTGNSRSAPPSSQTAARP